MVKKINLVGTLLLVVVMCVSFGDYVHACCCEAPDIENTYISNSYSKSGWSKYNMLDHLYGNYSLYERMTPYSKYLETTFVTHEQLEVLHQRVDVLEATIREVPVLLVRAERLNMVLKEDDLICSPDIGCFTFV